MLTALLHVSLRKAALATGGPHSALLQVAGVALPPLRELFGTAPLGPVDLLGCAAVGVLPGLVLRLTRPIGSPGPGSRDQRPGARDGRL